MKSLVAQNQKLTRDGLQIRPSYLKHRNICGNKYLIIFATVGRWRYLLFVALFTYFEGTRVLNVQQLFRLVELIS